MTRSPAAVLLTLLLVACSGGGSDDLTKPEVVRRANAICAKANRAIAGMYRPDPDDTAATADALAKVTARQRVALRQLQDLVPPADDASDYGRWLTQIDLALDRAAESSEAIGAGDVVTADDANRRGEQIRTDADRFAAGYGMTRCAQPE